MAYTSSDLTEIQTAIMALAKGERVVTVNLNGEQIEYGQARLSDLKELRDIIQQDISTAATNPRHVFAVTSKGY